MAKIAASILSADFTNLGKEINKAKSADMIHFDVMDGHFVPNITFGPAILEAVRRATKLPIEAHLMIENPAQFIEAFAKAGANTITAHIEADRNINRTLSKIKDMGAKAGICLNPETEAAKIKQAMENADLIVIMTVNPGFGGQKFMEQMLPKIRKIKEMIKEKKLKTEIEVDGGINEETARKAIQAGADILVVGSYIYHSKNAEATIKHLKNMQPEKI